MPNLLAVSWWVPFASTLFVVAVAATVSYCVTWRFKRADRTRATLGCADAEWPNTETQAVVPYDERIQRNAEGCA
jgi:hypothetical protein